jgi:diaminohydroxyphosphoribosylaminopyrimidine deaminase/5-amino-6-(5-phosphoribosylamino)uracil reductase
MATPAETAAMRRALELAASEAVPLGPNPRVGCVLIDLSGRTVGEGYHRGAGTPHAEAVALLAAGAAARGATAVVTLEPCNHTGRTGPCAIALVDAGVARVVYGQADTNPVAAGGAAALRAAGVDVEGGLLEDAAAAVNVAWTFALTHGRPMVTWKCATSLDGRAAAADGSSRWITGAAARADVHVLRSTVDAVLVGTGTVLADDPRLTARAGGGDGAELPADRQPLRVVVGSRTIPPHAHVFDDAAPTLQLATHDLPGVLATLYARGVQHVLLEGGPTLAGAFVAAGLVDRVVTYLAPVLLGAGPAVLGAAGITTISAALRLRTQDVTRLGEDVRITALVTELARNGEEA